MIGAIILGLVAGAIARALVPTPMFSGLRGPKSWVVSLVVGLVGSWIGWWLFTGVLGIGDADKFDLGGIVGAIAGAVLLLWGLRFLGRRAG
jgi:uncharacterized membrane protein YeaQ/YmgE (transglycosylase-associated protein family)